MQVAFEQSSVVTEQFRTRIAGHCLQGLVNVDDGSLKIGNENGVAGRFKSLLKQSIHVLESMTSHRFLHALGQFGQERQIGILDHVVESTGVQHARGHMSGLVLRDHQYRG